MERLRKNCRLIFFIFIFLHLICNQIKFPYFNLFFRLLKFKEEEEALKLFLKIIIIIISQSFVCICLVVIGEYVKNASKAKLKKKLKRNHKLLTLENIKLSSKKM